MLKRFSVFLVSLQAVFAPTACCFSNQNIVREFVLLSERKSIHRDRRAQRNSTWRCVAYRQEHSKQTRHAFCCLQEELLQSLFSLPLRWYPTWWHRRFHLRRRLSSRPEQL